MIVSSNWAAYVISGIIFLFSSVWHFFDLRLPWRERLHEVWKAKKKDIFRSSVLLALFWAILFSASFVNVLHEDRAAWEVAIKNSQQLQGDNQQLRTDIKALKEQNQDLRNQLSGLTAKEPPNSLRRRTLRLVNDLTLFWRHRPDAPPQPVQNPSTEEDRQRNAKWNEYWKDVETAYNSANYRGKLLGIVRDYKAKGLSTGWLEDGIAQPTRFIGDYMRWPGAEEDCSRSTSEICQLRELAYHVDAQDQPIFLKVDSQ